MPEKTSETTLTQADLRLANATTVLRRSCSCYAAAEMTDALPRIPAQFLPKPLNTLVLSGDLLKAVQKSLPRSLSVKEGDSDPVLAWLIHTMEALHNLLAGNLSCDRRTAATTPYYLSAPLSCPIEEVIITAILNTPHKGPLVMNESVLASIQLPDRITILGESIDLKKEQFAIREKILQIFPQRQTEWARTHGLRSQIKDPGMIYKPFTKTPPKARVVLKDGSLAPVPSDYTVSGWATGDLQRLRRHRPFADPTRHRQLSRQGQKKMGAIGDSLFTICRGPGKDCPRYDTIAIAGDDFSRHPELVVVKTTEKSRPRFFIVDERFIEPVN